MHRGQAPPWQPELLALSVERLGPLPLINHFLERLALEAHLECFVPAIRRRLRLPYAKGLGVLLRSLLVEREPMYRQHETVSTFSPQAFGLDEGLVDAVSDDAVGRALDHLFDTDRAALLTEVIVGAVQGFDVALDELHNDSTSVRFCGQYTEARGRKLRGKRAPFITYGYSKDHRPDLKQLLFILTTTHDGGVPVQFRCEQGNASDSRTHEETWEALRRAAGRVDFLYVADSKLCSREPMDYIHRRGGRFVCVMPRSRREDAEFREWLQTHEPEWTPVWDRPNPRRHGGPRDRWWVFRHPLPSREGWPLIWVYSSLLATRQERTRHERLAQAHQALQALNTKLTGSRPRRRSREELEHRVEAIIRTHKVARYLNIALTQDEEHHFRQARPGRPGPNTAYVRKTRTFWRVQWDIDEKAIDYDRKSDGMYPLLTNDRTLTDAQVLEAHKRQPTIEKRFEQTKTVFEIAPVLLKNEGRVEALFFIYFLALLVQALIERELRRAMQRQGVENLPLYPEERTTQRPTAEQIFRLFSLTQRHVLKYQGDIVHTFEPELTDLQRQVLVLLGIPETVYHTVT
ncbi:MAG: IS1634 family transposase [Actinobacteria bacterium]|nr:IS1634 family transposase [Actinomycetota bacterium]